MTNTTTTNIRGWVRRICCAALVAGLLPCALGQQSPARGDDSTDSPLLRQRQRVHQAEKKKNHAAEKDDPAARFEWTRRAMGEPTQEYKRRLRREAERKHSLYPQLMPRSGGKTSAPASVSGSTGPLPSSASISTDNTGASGTTAGVPVWIPLGPGAEDYEQNGPSIHTTVSGRLRKILTHPTDANTVYVLAAGGGLWRTSNFLSDPPSWTPLTDAQPTTSGGSVAFGRTPSVLYLGTGDPFDVVLIGGGMLKSSDGGNTWSSAVDLPGTLSIRDVAVDTSGAQDVVLVATDVGLFRSGDSGATYTSVGGVFQNQQVWSLVKTGAGWLASTEMNSGIGPNGGGAGSLYISTDTGLTWSPITNTNSGFNGAGRTTLAVAAPGDNIVYAFAASCNDPRFTSPNCDQDQWDLFRSTNGGQDWTALGLRSKTPVNPLSQDQPDMDVMHDQAWYNQMLLVDPGDPERNTVYIGGNLTSDKSTDGGNTWEILTDWANGFYGRPYVHADFHTGAFGMNGLVLVGGDGGLFISSDSGASWSGNKNIGLETFEAYTLASTPTFPSAVIAGFQDNGTRVRSGDIHVFNGSIGGDGTGLGWSQANSERSFGSAAFSNLGFNLTEQVPDLLENWIFTDFGSRNPGFFTIVATPSAQADPTGLVFFTADLTDVFDTADGGSTFSDFVSFNPDIRNLPHTVGIGNDVNHLAVGLSRGFVCYSDNALDFRTYQCPSLSSLVPGFDGFIAAVAWGDNDSLYASSVANNAGAVHVVKGSNIFSGGSWSRADAGLPDAAVFVLKVDPSDPSGNTVLAGTAFGVYRTTDGGANWQLYGAGLPNVLVTDIYMPPDGSFIRIGTYGRGLWELPQLSFESASLNDDVTSCDHNGSLDNGETGHLTITLKNHSGSDLANISATVSTTNPNVSFPNGNTVSFPAAAAHGTTMASIEVALNGASGIQQIDFTTAFTDPSLGLASPITANSSFRANSQETLASSVNDDVEAPDSTWTTAGTAENSPDIFPWQIRQAGPLQHNWVGLDSNAVTDEFLVSPTLQIGNAPFSFNFTHRYAFAFPPNFYDGGVIEISSDAGSSWSDIGAFASPGYSNTLAASANPLAGRSAYAGFSPNYPAFEPVTVNLGTAYAGKSVQIRFRVGTANALVLSGARVSGRPGWELDNFTFTGLTNSPFNALAAHSSSCSTSATLSSSANPSVFGQPVTLTAQVNGGLTAATGNVQFNDGGSAIGSATLNASAQASFSTPALSVADHNLTAQYAGDATHASSLSPGFVQTVQKAGTTLSLSSSSDPAVVGSAITFTAAASVVAPGAGAPGGSVNFLVDGSLAGAGTLTNGSASFSTSALAAGIHTVSAHYEGDGNFETSDGTLSGGETVDPAAPMIVSPVSGTKTTNPAVTVSGTASANASISLFDGNVGVATGSADSAGNFSLTLTLPSGTHSLTATQTVSGATSSASSVVSITILQVATVVDYRVLFGAQSFSLFGSSRNRLPWQIVGIQVTFSEPIASGDSNSLSGVSVSGFSGLGTSTLTWTINPIALGNVATVLASTGPHALKDAMGTPIASFTMNFRVLEGDYNDDGAVASNDAVGVNNASKAPYNIFADINGDGAVNLADVQVVRTRIGTSLP